MSTNKRVSNDYNITSASGTGTVTLEAATVNVTGNLVVAGTTTTVNSTDTNIKDRVIELNSGESGSSVSGNIAGISIDRGSSNPARLVYVDSRDRWEVDGGDGNLAAIGSADVVADTTPQLGGNLDVNGKSIVSVSNGNVVIAPNGTGVLRIDGCAVRLQNESGDPSSESGFNLVYAKTAGSGGSGLFTTAGGPDELVTNSKAIVYGIIF